MSAAEQLTNLADMVRERARTRGDAIAYEFEGRQTTFAEFDIKTNRERRDPYAVSSLIRQVSVISLDRRASIHALWVWVPAFAGTTTR